MGAGSIRVGSDVQWRKMCFGVCNWQKLEDCQGHGRNSAQHAVPSGRRSSANQRRGRSQHISAVSWMQRLDDCVQSTDSPGTAYTSVTWVMMISCKALILQVHPTPRPRGSWWLRANHSFSRYSLHLGHVGHDDCVQSTDSPGIAYTSATWVMMIACKALILQVQPTPRSRVSCWLRAKHWFSRYSLHLDHVNHDDCVQSTDSSGTAYTSATWVMMIACKALILQVQPTPRPRGSWWLRAKHSFSRYSLHLGHVAHAVDVLGSGVSASCIAGLAARQCGQPMVAYRSHRLYHGTWGIF